MTVGGGRDTPGPCGARLLREPLADAMRRQFISSCPEMRDADTDERIEIVRIKRAYAHGSLVMLDGDIRFTQAGLEKSAALPSPSGVRVECQGLLDQRCRFRKLARSGMRRAQHREHEWVAAIKARSLLASASADMRSSVGVVVQR